MSTSKRVKNNKFLAHLQFDGASYPVETHISSGGVSRNISEALFKLYGDVHLISAVGNDEYGRNLKSFLPESFQKGMITHESKPTASACVIIDKFGDCKLVLLDLQIHKSITPDLIIKNEHEIAKCPLVIMDSNLSLDTMATILEISKKYGKPVFFEPTDMRIADKPYKLPQDLHKQIKFTTPNIFELQAIAVSLGKYDPQSNLDISLSNKEATLKLAKELLKSVEENFDCVILTLGELGIVVSRRNNAAATFFSHEFKYITKFGSFSEFRYYEAPKVSKLVNVSGAGDSFASGFIAAMLQGKEEGNCVSLGFHAARCALLSRGAVPEVYFKNKEEKNDAILKTSKYVKL